MRRAPESVRQASGQHFLRPGEVPVKAQIFRELAAFAKPENSKGLAVYFFDFVLYWGAITTVLLAHPMICKVIGSIVAGVKLAAFLTLGHDAAHRTLVKSKSLNKWLACACFVPCMHNYRLWIWDHHEMHHAQTNGEHFDSYTPYSKEEFDRLPWRKQIFERVIRAPNIIGFGIHYLFQRMMRVQIFPRKEVPERHRQSAWAHFSLLVTYHSAFLMTLCAAPAFAPVSAACAVVLGFILPMFVFATVTGGALYLMHTHRDIPWFKGEPDQSGNVKAEYWATDLTLPLPVSNVVHNVFSHSVHHAHPGVPCYLVPQAQKRLNELIGARAVSEPLSFRRAVETMKACKLYDFEKHQWIDFDGRPTTGSLDVGRSASQVTSGDLA
jgi:omega-6 fatty acid desaturase (delta-12 desaturase)